MNDIEKKIIQILTGLKRIDDLPGLSAESNIIEQAHLDSLEIITFILEVERFFEIEMDFESFDIDHLTSISIFSKFIKTHLERK